MIAVDLFAGAGGWSEGARMAGVRVAAAVNHWPLAVQAHALNHLETDHRCQDVALMDPRDLPAHEILLASPACQGHSRARGTDKPHHDASRATAWAVVDVAEVTRPRLLLVENVPDFTRWALYPLWREALTRLGYGISENVMDASQCGVPQERRRLFIVGVLGGQAPRLREPGPMGAPAREIIDWHSDGWSPVEKPGRAPRTLARIAAGRAQHGGRFVAPYYGSGSGATGRSIDRPIGTITTLARWAVVDGDRMRMLSIPESKRAMGFPVGYRLAGTKREQLMLLGNAVPPPMAACVLGQALEAMPGRAAA